MRPGAFVGPVVVIVLGVLFLLNNMGVAIPMGDLIRNGWPFLVILVGVMQLLGGFAGRGSLPGGVILIVIGTLFAAERLAGVSFRNTWPVLLIAVGVLGLLRAAAGESWGRRGFRGGMMR